MLHITVDIGQQELKCGHRKLLKNEEITKVGAAVESVSNGKHIFFFIYLPIYNVYKCI